MRLCWLNDETKNWNSSRLDHREHLLTWSHIFLDLKLKSELLKRKSHLFHSRRAVAAGRHTQEQLIVCTGSRVSSCLHTSPVCSYLLVCMKNLVMCWALSSISIVCSCALWKASGVHISEVLPTSRALKAADTPITPEEQQLLYLCYRGSHTQKKKLLFISRQMFFKSFQQSCNHLQKLACLNRTQRSYSGTALLWQHSLLHP